ncbi:MAG: type II toxin-antitoxin system Phd/YefM family antitoxin [Sulfurovum sp.]|nr:type II toxin-antitoxin system Phd/YefM family antitoxin [Sulfurovum sp.]
MTTITASDLKQNTMRLQDALRDDLLVTKRDKPFVVVMDYEKYKRLEKFIAAMEEKPLKNDGYPSISFDEACDRVAEAVQRYKSRKGDYTELDDAYWEKMDRLIENTKR